MLALTLLAASTIKGAVADTPSPPGVLRVVYFHSPSCHECERVRNFLPQVTSRWGDRIALELHSVDDINVFNELFEYEKQYKVTVDAPPAIFVGGSAHYRDAGNSGDTLLNSGRQSGSSAFCPPVADLPAFGG